MTDIPLAGITLIGLPLISTYTISGTLFDNDLAVLTLSVVVLVETPQEVNLWEELS